MCVVIECIIIILYSCVFTCMCVQIAARTALHYAAEYGHMESIQILLSGGANMEIKDEVSAWCNIIHTGVMSFLD